MEQKAISIIIPTHNNAHYLKRSLASCLEQDFKLPFEILVIDDCSEDETKQIVEELRKEHSNIRYFYVANRCPLKNRLYGVEQAEGECIIFLDADDYLAKNMLSKMHQTLKENEADLVNCGMNYIKKGGIRPSKLVKDATYNRNEAIKALFDDTSFRSFLHTKIFKKELLLKMDFLGKIELHNFMFEDSLLCFHYLLLSKKVISIKDRLHYYEKTNEGSATSKGYQRAIDNVSVRTSIRAKIEDMGDTDLRKLFLKSKVRTRLLLASDYVLSVFPDKKTKKEIKAKTKADFKNAYGKTFSRDKANYKELVY